MCSRLLPRKGFQYVIEAIGRMKLDWQVNIIGDGPYLSHLKELAAGVETPVKFWGWLDRGDEMFRRLFEESAIFVFPSEAENFPTVLLEAMAAGTAIITSRAGGCPEVVADSGILVEPGDVGAIKKALEQLTQSDELRQRLSEAALSRVQQFGWGRIAGHYLDVYEELVNKKSSQQMEGLHSISDDEPANGRGR
jgi:glycosyltransferase involved in cell wall biosynthesis